jgi:polyhydroxybutyrate depolymerase
MFNLGRIFLPIVLIFGVAACDEDPESHRYPHPIFGGDGAVALDAAVMADAASGTDASLGFDAASDAALGLGVDAAPPPNVGDASLPANEAGSADGGVDAAPAVDASRADATTPGDATISGDATSGDAASGDAASGDASTPAAPGPAQMRSVTVGGVTRTFQLYIPKSAVKATPAPLVSVHHGFTMTGKIMEEISSWKKIAEREGIVVAFPDGLNPPWNVGQNVCGLGAWVSASPDQDDFGFVKAIIESADKDQSIKKDAVFVGGFSMGGYFANHVACMGRDFVRAAAGQSSGTFDGTCPGQPIPMLLIHGDADGLIDYQCSVQSRGYWTSRNGCSMQTTTETIKGGSCEWQQGCPAGREVGFCTMNGMDHGWAGAPTSGPGAWLSAAVGLNGNLDYGGGVEYEDAAELMWKFFKKYR